MGEEGRGAAVEEAGTTEAVADDAVVGGSEAASSSLDHQFPPWSYLEPKESQMNDNCLY